MNHTDAIVDRDTKEIILLHCQRTGDDPENVAKDLEAGMRRIRVGKCYETWIETLDLESQEWMLPHQKDFARWGLTNPDSKIRIIG